MRPSRFLLFFILAYGFAFASPLISYTDENGGIAGVPLDVGRRSVAYSWTQTVSGENISISLPFQSDSIPLTAFLTTRLGPETTIANEIARANFVGQPTIPFFFPDSSYTTIFTGLNLGPGTYYLTIFSNGGTSTATGDYVLPGNLFTAPGYTPGPFYFGPNPWDADPLYPPASPYTPDTYIFTYYIRLETNPVPEPSSVGSAGIGLVALCALAARRRA